MLSIILTVPIVAIIVVSIVNQPNMTYTVYEASTDFSDLEFEKVRVGSIEEEIEAIGIFESNNISQIECTIPEGNSILLFVEEGDYLEPDTVLFAINDKKHMLKDYGMTALPAVVEKIYSDGDKVSIRISDTAVSYVVTGIDVRYYPTIENSKISFSIDNHEYRGLFIGKEKSATDNGKLFNAYYSIEDYGANDNSLLCNSKNNIYVKTGTVHNNARIVPKQCIFLINGRYYIQTIEDDSIKRIEVKLGISNKDSIEIISLDDTYNIKENQSIIVNNINVFEQTNENEVNEEKGTNATDE